VQKCPRAELSCAPAQVAARAIKVAAPQTPEFAVCLFSLLVHSALAGSPPSPRVRPQVMDAFDMPAVLRLQDKIGRQFNKVFIDINGSRDIGTVCDCLDKYQKASGGVGHGGARCFARASMRVHAPRAGRQGARARPPQPDPCDCAAAGLLCCMGRASPFFTSKRGLRGRGSPFCEVQSGCGGAGAPFLECTLEAQKPFSEEQLGSGGAGAPCLECTGAPGPAEAPFLTRKGAPGVREPLFSKCV